MGVDPHHYQRLLPVTNTDGDHNPRRNTDTVRHDLATAERHSNPDTNAYTNTSIHADTYCNPISDTHTESSSAAQ